jgi:hypothetical protein
MNNFRPHITPVYPPNNHLIFEEWFGMNYFGCNTDRELMKIFPTSYWVNHDYGNDKVAAREIQYYVDQLDPTKKYFIVCQYDDGCMINWNGKDILEFNMSKKVGVELPLLCQPHPYKFSGSKKIFASFVGSRTHPIRNSLDPLAGKDGYRISFEYGGIEDYCRVLHESMFALAPRGYGINSFRIAEAVQYGAIPVYISDEFIEPFGIDFNEIGIKIHSSEVSKIDDILSSIDPMKVIELQDQLPHWYRKLYSYGGCFNKIIKSLEAEFNSRQEKAESPEAA